MPDAAPAYEDDATIGDDAQLWRNIPPWHIVEDSNRGGKRISKAAFEDHPDGSPMSVVLGDEVLASGRKASSLIAQRDGFRLASITAKLAREQNQGIARKPLDTEPSHAEVFGRKTESVRKSFARGAVWVIGPDVDSPENHG
ncbi:MAG: hypothetical protein O2931_03035 [Planctomycetota bacterium]|nr:hypothetical protein [Planctomycetota bacterium]MDA1177752.1 hypothetical protein [Planctomycetota bacterium]